MSVVQVLSWNINGLRSFKMDMKKFLTDLKADVICFQETKVTRDMLEESQAIVEGYSSYFSFSRKRSGYSGVATFCSERATPIAAQEGLSGLFPGELTDGSGTCTALPGRWREEELKELDSEGRAVITQHMLKDKNDKERKVAIINVYCPRVDPEKPERRRFKLRFYELLRQRAAALHTSGSHVVIVGDMNTSHKRIDHCDPDESEVFENRLERRYFDLFLKPVPVGTHDRNPPHDVKAVAVVSSSGERKGNDDQSCDDHKLSEKLCTVDSDMPRECVNEGIVSDNYKTKNDNGDQRNFVSAFQAVPENEAELEQLDDCLLVSDTDFQVVDTFRYFYPQRREAFTCWNVYTNSRSTNYGTRLDYVLCDEDFILHVNDSLVLQEVMGSDHCPVTAIIAGVFVPSSQIPKSCTKFFPEFRGQQQKLTSYFHPKSDSNRNMKSSVHSLPHPQRMGSMTCKASQDFTKRVICNDKTKSSKNKKQCMGKLKNISSFFISKTNGSQYSSSKVSDSECEDQNPIESSGNPNSEHLSFSSAVSSSQFSTESDGSSDTISQTSSSPTLTMDNSKNNVQNYNKSNQTKDKGWGFLMKGPRPIPVCSGHKEPCVLRTVKKKGPNLNRQFYACARGAGKEGDPNAQCNYFKWVGK